MADSPAGLRILYSFPHPLNRPGIAETALRQVLGLERLGARLTLFVASVGTIHLPETIALHQTMVVAGQRVPHRAIGVQRAYGLHDYRVAAWLRRHPDDFDVVHAWPRGCLRTLNTARALGVPALRESPNAHTASGLRASAQAADSVGVALPANHSHAANPEVLARELREYDAASAVLVPSPYAYAEFVREGYPAERLLQHRYGCDLGRFPPRRPGSGAGRPFRAVFVGRGDPTKGLHVALDAWAAADLPGAEFLIAGSILPDYGRYLADRLRAPGVRTLGFVTDIPGLFANADVLVLPSWTEGSALVILEAQASGCVPLVSASSGALGVPGLDYLEHPVGAVDVLAGQLRELASDRSRLEQLSARGTQRRPFLSWDAAAQTLLGCYREALTMPVASGGGSAAAGRGND